MKKVFLIFGILMTGVVFSQEKNNTVQKSIIGLQIGFFGLDVYNEFKISDEIALRPQFSLNPSIWGGDLYSKTNFAFSPSLSLTSKYYYNLNKREEKGKNTRNNSANYLAFKVEYFPNWFVISNTKDLTVNDAIYMIPHYGFRRNFAMNFNYEFLAGIGIGKILKSNFSTQLRPEISFKIGYDF